MLQPELNYLSFITILINKLNFTGAAATHKPCLWSDKNGKITDEPYDEASEICCEKSGKHTKINHQGHKIDCCGGKLFFRFTLIFHCSFYSVKK